MVVHFWWLFTAFKIFLCVNKSIASLSGFYVDNGNSQTVMHRELKPSDTQTVEHEILELLGMPDRPSWKHRHHSMQKSAPKFLLDIYKQLDDEMQHISGRYKRSFEGGRNVFSEVNRGLIDESDSILTFLSKKNRIAKVCHERGRKLFFDMAKADRDSKLMMAKLRIYQKPSPRKRYFDAKELRITAYAIVKSGNELELMMLSSTNTTSNHRGWLELVVSHGLSRWLTDCRLNEGLFITVHDKDSHEIRPDVIGLENFKGDEEHQPFIVAFFKGPNFVKMGKSTRDKRNTPHNSKLLNPLVGSKSQLEIVKSCQIQTLYISFKDLKWQDWIIAPTGYGAFFCSGECNFPLNTHMNATNHAIVQTLVHLQNPSKVPKPCCAPIKLSPISVIFFLDDTHVNLKKYKNMVVTSCGCH